MEAATKMRNNNEYPVTVLADKDTPFKKNWNNYTSIGWTFCGHYQAADGVTDSSDLALPIQAYVFHGQYYFTRTIRGEKKTVKRPIIHALHLLLTCHRSRFVKDVDKHFKMLFELLDKHPEWEKFLTDLGKGEAPRLFLIAVEVGIRRYAFAKNAKLTMGIGPTRVLTKHVYGLIEPWRKMECYITAGRFRKGRHTYRKWEEFSWADYTERDALAQTFTVRHLPLSDGDDHFGGELADPNLRWGSPANTPTKQKRKRSKVGRVKAGRVKVEKGCESTPQKYDRVKGCMVPIIDLC